MCNDTTKLLLGVNDNHIKLKMVFENMIELLYELTESYPKNIKIKEDRTDD